jgi:hypothetical protein
MKKSELQQIIKEEISSYEKNIDEINKSRRALFGLRDLRRGEFAFFEDQKAHMMLDQIIKYLEKKIEKLGGNYKS